MPARRKHPKVDLGTERDRLMESYEVLNMAGLATLFGVDIRTLQNRPDKNLPPYSKVGAQRLFFKQDVVDWMRRRMNRR